MTTTLEHQGQDTVSASARCQGQVLSLWRGTITPPPRARMPIIAAEIAALHGVTVEELKLPTGGKVICAARHHAMWAMTQVPHLSHRMIGRFLGGRDATTVGHGVMRHQSALDAMLAAEMAA
jgi:chromosomal replication initiation ATPase DnaA